jgi:hypothetical protein
MTDDEEFSESLFITKATLALSNAISDWPVERPIAPLLQQLHEHLDHQQRRRDAWIADPELLAQVRRAQQEIAALEAERGEPHLLEEDD